MVRMTQDEFLKNIKEVFERCYSVVEKKNRDYSGKDALANIFKCEDMGVCDAEIGILVRCSDKFSRIANILKSKEYFVKEETVEDTIIDLINYLAILLVVLQYKRKVRKENKS